MLFEALTTQRPPPSARDPTREKLAAQIVAAAEAAYSAVLGPHHVQKFEHALVLKNRAKIVSLLKEPKLKRVVEEMITTARRLKTRSQDHRQRLFVDLCRSGCTSYRKELAKHRRTALKYDVVSGKFEKATENIGDLFEVQYVRTHLSRYYITLAKKELLALWADYLPMPIDVRHDPALAATGIDFSKVDGARVPCKVLFVSFVKVVMESHLRSLVRWFVDKDGELRRNHWLFFIGPDGFPHMSSHPDGSTSAPVECANLMLAGQLMIFLLCVFAVMKKETSEEVHALMWLAQDEMHALQVVP